MLAAVMHYLVSSSDHTQVEKNAAGLGATSISE